MSIPRTFRPLFLRCLAFTAALFFGFGLLIKKALPSGHYVGMKSQNLLKINSSLVVSSKIFLERKENQRSKVLRTTALTATLSGLPIRHYNLRGSHFLSFRITIA